MNKTAVFTLLAGLATGPSLAHAWGEEDPARSDQSETTSDTWSSETPATTSNEAWDEQRPTTGGEAMQQEPTTRGEAAQEPTTSGMAAPAAPPMQGPSVVLPQASAALGASVTVTSIPGDSISSNYHVDFDAMDTNGDGSITHTEARGNEDLMREFNVVDTDKNGRLTRDEMKGWLE